MSIVQEQRVERQNKEVEAYVQKNNKDLVYFLYDYTFDPKEFMARYPSAKYKSIGYVGGWEWIVDEEDRPNLRKKFYDNRKHIPKGTIRWPAENREECDKDRTTGVIGWLFTISKEDLQTIDEEMAATGMKKVYEVVVRPPPSRTEYASRIWGVFHRDIRSTCEPLVDLKPEKNDVWKAAVTRLQRSGIPEPYIDHIKRKLEGHLVCVEPWEVTKIALKVCPTSPMVETPIPSVVKSSPPQTVLQSVSPPSEPVSTLPSSGPSPIGLTLPSSKEMALLNPYEQQEAILRSQKMAFISPHTQQAAMLRFRREHPATASTHISSPPAQPPRSLIVSLKMPILPSSKPSGVATVPSARFNGIPGISSVQLASHGTFKPFGNDEPDFRKMVENEVIQKQKNSAGLGRFRKVLGSNDGPKKVVPAEHVLPSQTHPAIKKPTKPRNARATGTKIAGPTYEEKLEQNEEMEIQKKIQNEGMNKSLRGLGTRMNTHVPEHPGIPLSMGMDGTAMSRYTPLDANTVAILPSNMGNTGNMAPYRSANRTIANQHINTNQGTNMVQHANNTLPNQRVNANLMQQTNNISTHQQVNLNKVQQTYNTHPNQQVSSNTMQQTYNTPSNQQVSSNTMQQANITQPNPRRLSTERFTPFTYRAAGKPGNPSDAGTGGRN